MDAAMQRRCQQFAKCSQRFLVEAFLNDQWGGKGKKMKHKYINKRDGEKDQPFWIRLFNHEYAFLSSTNSSGSIFRRMLSSECCSQEPTHKAHPLQRSCQSCRPEWTPAHSGTRVSHKQAYWIILALLTTWNLVFRKNASSPFK